MSSEAVPDQSAKATEAPPASGQARLKHRLRDLFAWALAHRAQAGLILAACLISVGAVVALLVAFLHVRAEASRVSPEKALAALDAGAWEEARRWALRLRQQPRPPLDDLATAAYVLGRVAAQEAEGAFGGHARQLFLLAARYLEEARDRGFPPGREGDGLWLLGYCLFRSGQFATARLVLREALPANPARRTQIWRLLAEACLRDGSPKLKDALQYNARLLADKSLSQEDRHAAFVQRAEILLRMGRWQDCLKQLESVPPDSTHWGEAMVLAGRAKMAEAGQRGEDATAAPTEADVERCYHEAIQLFARAADRSTAAAPQAIYLTGVALAELGQLDGAIRKLAQVSRNYSDQPEALAAEVKMAALLRQAGRGADALRIYQRVLGEMGDPRSFVNPWLTVDELRGQAMAAFEELFQQRQFDAALKMAEAMRPVLAQSQVVELKGETHRAWGRHLLEQASRLPATKAESLRRAARRHLRQAGATFAVLARLRITTRAYPDDLWASAQSYFDGQNYSAAAQMLRKYLENETRRRARALVLLGSALLALGRPDEALIPLQQCIDFHPRDPASFRARLVAAAACLEKGEAKQAEQLLLENLQGGALTPASGEFRDSLFALGRMLHLQARYEEAVLRLEEAVSRYEDDPRAAEAYYLLGDCWYQTARQTNRQREAEPVPQRRAQLAKQAKTALGCALACFQKARQKLEQFGQPAELAPDQKATLRNCYFALGDIQADLGDWPAAVKTYREVVRQFAQSPAVLEAYLQLARIYERLNRTEEARRAIWEAQRTLERIQTDADFTTVTNRTREQWVQLFDQLAQEFSNTMQS